MSNLRVYGSASLPAQDRRHARNWAVVQPGEQDCIKSVQVTGEIPPAGFAGETAVNWKYQSEYYNNYNQLFCSIFMARFWPCPIGFFWPQDGWNSSSYPVILLDFELFLLLPISFLLCNPDSDQMAKESSII